MIYGVHGAELQIEELFELQQKFHLKLLMPPINVVAVHCVHSNEKHKKNGKFSTIEYLDAVIEHERKCFKNHFTSSQLSKLFPVFLTEKKKAQLHSITILHKMWHIYFLAWKFERYVI